jgi:outer membrane receptor for ferrienterochelin and colicin
MLHRPLLIFLPVLTLGNAALAQQASETPIQQVEVKGPGALELRRNDTAGRIVVGREELARYGDTTLSGALRRQPGLSVAGSEIRMRGLGAGYTQILIDGDPAPAGFAVDTLSPDLVERIEILRSASADTSAQAVAGSINIVLRKATGAAHRSLKLGAEQAQRRTSPSATLQWSGRDGARSYGLAATLSQVRRHDDPLIAERAAGTAEGDALRRFDEQDDTRVTKLSLAPRIDIKLPGADTLGLQALFDLSRYSFTGSQRETTLLGTPTASPDARWQGVYDTWLAKSDLSWSHRFDIAKLVLKAGVEANRRPGDYLFRGTDAGGQPWFERAVTSSATERRVSSSGKYVAPLGASHDIALGWDAAATRRGETRLQRDSVPGQAPYAVLDQDYQATVGRLALYAQDEWTPRPGLQAYLGLRWEGLDTATDGRGYSGAATWCRAATRSTTTTARPPPTSRATRRCARNWPGAWTRPSNPISRATAWPACRCMRAASVTWCCSACGRTAPPG